MRRWFHIAIALILVACAISPFAETAIRWNQSIFTTGHDTESTIAVMALLIVLAFSLARLLAAFAPILLGTYLSVSSPAFKQALRGLVFIIPETSSPPLPLRI
jgi:p-aminobenzoyl-glutamate transporter AbgT